MALPRPGSLDPKLAELLISEIKRQSLSGKSSRAIASELGIHYQTVANYRRRLEREGLIDRLPGGRTRLRRGALLGPVSAPPLSPPKAPIGSGGTGDMNSAPTLVTSAFLNNLEELEVLTPEQVLKKLTWMSLSPEVPPTVQVQASKALYEIGEAERARASLERSIPSTREEALDRLCIQRSAVGPELWLAAHTRVTAEEESWRTSRLSPLEVTPGGATSPVPAAGTVPAADAPTPDSPTPQEQEV